MAYEQTSPLSAELALRAERPRYYGLSEIARRFPSSRCLPAGPRGDLDTVDPLRCSWSAQGSAIKLEAKRLPGRWVVTDEAVAEFIERLNYPPRQRAHSFRDPATASRRKSVERGPPAVRLNRYSTTNGENAPPTALGGASRVHLASRRPSPAAELPASQGRTE